MGKSAVVLILDANHSMNKRIQPDDKNDDKNGNDGGCNNDIITRFDCAKQVANALISDLMIQSKTNEVGVIVLKTPQTCHHLFDENDSDCCDSDEDMDDPNNIPYKNITEIGGSGEGFGVCRPNSDLLRRIAKLRPTTTNNDSSNDLLQGDFVDGIIVGADALQKRTGKRKYIRRIILITDAEHKIHVNQELFQVIDGLRTMECQLEVIGFDFEKQGEYNHAAVSSSSTTKPEETKSNIMDVDNNSNNMNDNNDDSETDVSGDDDDDNGEDDGSDDDDDDDEEEDGDMSQIIKQQNEPLLLSLTEKTGGFVMSAKEIQPILNKLLGQRQTKSMRKNALLQIAPTLTVQAKFFLLVTKTSVPTVTKKVAIMDDENSPDPKNLQPKINSLGEEMHEDLTTLVSFWDPENQDIEIWDTTKAYWYGSDLIPMGGLDMNGLINPSPVKIQILGYMSSSKVPQEYRCGPTYCISGGTSRQACASISALAQGLHKLQHVAIATWVKNKDADPILIGLFPLVDGNKSQKPIHLVMMQLPFEGDIPNLPNKLFTQMKQDNDNDEGTTTTTTTTTPAGGGQQPQQLTKQQQVCDDFIDSLMLPPDKLDYTKIPNPYIRSFNKTVIQRVIDPKANIVSVRRKMTTTTSVDDSSDNDSNIDNDDDNNENNNNNNNNDNKDDDYDDNDPMATTSMILREAQSSIDAFRKTFQIKTKSKDANKGGAKDGKKKKRKGPSTWRDYVNDESDDDDGNNNQKDDNNK